MHFTGQHYDAPVMIQDALILMQMGTGSRDSIGERFSSGGRKLVSCGAALSYVYCIPCDDDGEMRPYPRASLTNDGEKWSREATLRHLVRAYAANRNDRLSMMNAAGRAFSVDKPKCLLAAAWIICSHDATKEDSMAVNIRDLARYVGKSPWLPEIESRLPPLLVWAMDRTQRVSSRLNAPDHLKCPLESDHQTAVGLLQEALPEIIEDFQRDPLSVAMFTPATLRYTDEEVLVIGPADPNSTTYSVVSRFYDKSWVVWEEEIGAFDAPFEPGSAEYIEAACESLQFDDCLLALRDVAIDLPTWNLAYTAALGRWYRFLFSESSGSSAKRALKLALESFKECTKEEKAKLAAVFPEFVNPAKRGHVSFKHYDERMATAAAEILLDAMVPMYDHIDEMFYGDDDGLDDHEEEHSGDATTTVVEVPAEPVEKPKARVLRADVVVNDMLSLEWRLTQTEVAFTDASATALHWLGERLGTSMPATWSSGVHEIELGGVRVQVAANDRLFALRLEHPDSDHVARTWRLEAVIVKGVGAGSGGVGVRLSTHDRGAVKSAFRSVPGIVGALRSKPGLCVEDGVPEKMIIGTSFDLFRLRNELREPNRKHAIWVAAVGDEATLSRQPALVQVWYVQPAMLGEYGAAVETLTPGTWHAFAPAKVAPSIHQTSEARSTSDKLISSACRRNMTTPGFRDALDFVREAAAQAAERVERSNRMSAAIEVSPALTAAATDLQEQLNVAIGDADALRVELMDAQATIRQLKGRLHSLLVTHDAAEEAPAAPAEEYPRKLAEIGAWSKLLAPKVLFAEKAIRAASRIDHLQPELIFSILRALHDHYWPMRWGDDQGAKERWETFLMDSRLRCGPVGTAVDNHQFADAYRAVVAGKRIELAMHVQGNSTRDPRRCIRIYFACDDDRRAIAIGWLPSHLDSTHT